jgi:glycosyltransferase involved in cell wall biosynthesis
LLRAAKVIAVSAATRRDVESALGIPAERIRQIYDAPDPRFVTDEGATGGAEWAQVRRHTLERYQVNYPFILYAGTIRPQKNIPRLVEAFAVLRGELESHPLYRDLRLIIIGDEISKYPSVRRAVIQTRVEDRVRFLGFVPFETLRVFYEAAAAFVFPSLYEGFGLPPLEAMASGTPVVTSNVSSLPEVVGEAAVQVNPENVFEIARGMREALLDEARRSELIRLGYEQVRRFSWARTARQVLEIYQEVGQSRSGG